MIPKKEFDENRIIYYQYEILQHIKIFYDDIFTCKNFELIDVDITEIIKTAESLK